MRRGYQNSHLSFRNVGVIPKNSDLIIKLVSDFSKLIVAVIKTKFEKNDSNETHYRKQLQMIKKVIGIFSKRYVLTERRKEKCFLLIFEF